MNLKNLKKLNLDKYTLEDMHEHLTI